MPRNQPIHTAPTPQAKRATSTEFPRSSSNRLTEIETLLMACTTGDSGWARGVVAASRRCMLWPALGDEGLRPASPPPPPLPPLAALLAYKPRHKLAPLLFCAPCKPAQRKNHCTTQWYVQQVMSLLQRMRRCGLDPSTRRCVPCFLLVCGVFSSLQYY